jgi:hypothetical protein
MENANANPLIIALLCLLRCLIPLVIMLGISYLLKRFGLIAVTPDRPEEPSDYENPNNEKGDLAHGNT